MTGVSVVVPVRNCERYVGAALDSVLSQTCGDLEIIVVDDGSSDGTPAVLGKYPGRARILRQDTLGVSAARNRGISAARGEYVAFLDADDWWFPERLSAQFAALAAHPGAGFAFSDFSVTDADGVTQFESGIRRTYRLVRDERRLPWTRIFGEPQIVRVRDADGRTRDVRSYCGDMRGWLFQGNFVNTCSVLVRRAELERIGGFDETLGTEEDYDCWLRLAENVRMVYVDQPLVAYRRGHGQLTAREHRVAVMHNVVTVVERAAPRMKGVLRDAVIRARLARVRRDLGIVCLETRRRGEALRHLWRAVRRWPPDLRSAALLPFGFLPSSWFLATERCAIALRDRRQRRAE